MLKGLTIAAALAAALATGGCAQLGTLVGVYGGEPALALFEKAAKLGGKVEDATLGNAADTVANKYCPKVPGATRKGLRNALNSRPEMRAEDGSLKAQVGAWCKGDPPLILGPAPPE